MKSVQPFYCFHPKPDPTLLVEVEVPRYILLLICLLFAQLSTYAAALTIQPIQVCDSEGRVCANPNRVLFDQFTEAIWQQSGINVEFLPWRTLYNSQFLSIDSVPEVDLLFGLPPDLTGGSFGNVVNMWFVTALFPGQIDAGGLANLPGNQVLIANDIFLFNNPGYSGAPGQVNGRTDTVAHEIGHSLGLDHCEPQCNGSYLMAVNRTIPSSLADLWPAGNLDYIPANAGWSIRNSPLLDYNREFIEKWVLPIDWRTYRRRFIVNDPGLGIPTTPTNPPTDPIVPPPTNPITPNPTDPIANIPEPSTWALFGTGLVLILAGSHRRKR